MRRWYLAAFSLVVATTAWGGPPSGRVVRIERERVAADAAPLVCDIYESLRGLCIGRLPRNGELLTIVDEARLIAQVTISKVELDPSQRCDGLWSVAVEVLHGDLSQRSSDRIGVIDGVGDPRGLRKLEASEIGGSPSGNSEEVPILAIDRNGDRRPDVVVTKYPCDVNGHPAQSAPEHCLDVWSRRNTGTFARTSQTNLTACSAVRP